MNKKMIFLMTISAAVLWLELTFVLLLVLFKTEANEKFGGIEGELGNIDTALDSILQIQNSLIGGESV